MIGLSRRIDRVARLIALVGMSVMVVCLLFQSVARYGFAEPPAWTEELARLAMLWAGLAGATTALLGRRDPALVRYDRFRSPALRRLGRVLQSLSVLALCACVLWATPKFLAVHAQRVTGSLELPGEWVVAVVPVACAVLAVHAITHLLHELSPENDDDD